MTSDPTWQPAQPVAPSHLPPPCRAASSAAGGRAPPPVAASRTWKHDSESEGQLLKRKKQEEIFCSPLFGQLPLPLTLLLLLPLQLQPELLALADVPLCRPLVRLQQLGFVQRLQLLQLLLVFRNQLLDLRLQSWERKRREGSLGPVAPQGGTMFTP